MSTPVAAARSVKPLYLLAAATGALLYASFFPLDCGFLAWIALVPLFVLVRSDARPRHVYLAAFVGGLVFYVPAIRWMSVAHAAMVATWIILSIYSSLYFVLAIYLIRRLDRRGFSLYLIAPAVWISLEYMRAHFPTGFSWLEPLGVVHRIGFGWYFLGYSQHDFLPLIQIADLAGVYGVSFLIVMVNAVLFLWVARQPASAAAAPIEPDQTPVPGSQRGPGRARPWLGTAVAAILIAATLAYGFASLEHAPFEPGPRVALLQSNLSQSVKMDRAGEKKVEEYMLERLAEVGKGGDTPDLIVWPETTFSEDWYELARGVDASGVLPEGWREMLFLQNAAARGESTAMNFPEEWQRLIRKHELWRMMAVCRGNHLLGLNGIELDEEGRKWKYNSAKLVGADGRAGPRYDKMHLVPFGEYVPLRNTFPWMQHFTPYKGDYSCKPGEHWTRFPLTVGDKKYHFGCLICYEDSDPALARTYVRSSPEGGPADFLINISNDGWFDGTEEHEQHLAICRFRAVECRRAIARAVNMGISGIIDGDGRVVQIPGTTWSQSKKIAAVVNGGVPLDHRGSLYAEFGDWLPLACWGIVMVGLALTCCRCCLGSTRSALTS